MDTEGEWVVSVYDNQECKVPYKLNLPKSLVTLEDLMTALETVNRIYTGLVTNERAPEST
jgi:hypothetical protein